MTEAITELKSLTRGHRMGSDSADNANILDSLAGRIAKTLIYGAGNNSGADLEIGKIKKAHIDFAKQVKMKRSGQKSNIKKDRNFGELKKSKTRGQ